MRYFLGLVLALSLEGLGCTETAGTDGSSPYDYFGDECPGCQCEGDYENYRTTLDCFCCRFGCEPSKVPRCPEIQRVTEYDCNRLHIYEFSDNPTHDYWIDTTTGELLGACFGDDSGVCGRDDGLDLCAGESGITEACEVVSERTCYSSCCGEGVGPFACTELGIREAIAAAGGPHRFDCDGPTTISIARSLPVGSGDVILDGEGNITVEPRAYGGFAIEGVTAEFRGFTVSGNRAIYPAGTYGFFVYEGTLILVDSTVSGHVRGGILSERGKVVLRNSTLSENSQQAIVAGSLTATNSTVSADTTAIECGGTCTLANSLIRGACTSPIGSEGHNIESPGDTCGFDQPSDQPGVTAEQLNLGPLTDNGGPTMTHALLPGSVAIDQIPEEDCVDADGAPLTTDQRGYPRPIGDGCDVGAFELGCVSDADCSDGVACTWDVCFEGECVSQTFGCPWCEVPLSDYCSGDECPNWDEALAEGIEACQGPGYSGLSVGSGYCDGFRYLTVGGDYGGFTQYFDSSGAMVAMLGCTDCACLQCSSGGPDAFCINYGPVIDLLDCLRKPDPNRIVHCQSDW